MLVDRQEEDRRRIVQRKMGLSSVGSTTEANRILPTLQLVLYVEKKAIVMAAVIKEPASIIGNGIHFPRLPPLHTPWK